MNFSAVFISLLNVPRVPFLCVRNFINVTPQRNTERACCLMAMGGSFLAFSSWCLKLMSLLFSIWWWLFIVILLRLSLKWKASSFTGSWDFLQEQEEADVIGWLNKCHSTSTPNETMSCFTGSFCVSCWANMLTPTVTYIMSHYLQTDANNISEGWFNARYITIICWSQHNVLIFQKSTINS